MSSEKVLTILIHLGVALPSITVAILLSLLLFRQAIDAKIVSMIFTVAHCSFSVPLRVVSGNSALVSTLLLDILWGYIFFRGPPRFLLNQADLIFVALTCFLVILWLSGSVFWLSILSGLCFFVVAVKILFDGVEGIQEDISALIFVGFILHGWAASSRGDTLDLLIITLIVILLFVLKSCPISGDRSH